MDYGGSVSDGRDPPEHGHMFFRWCGGCGSNKAGLMNMLEAQNTLVSILNPTVLTCTTLKGTRDSYPEGNTMVTPSLGHTISRPLGLLGRSSNRTNASQSSNQEPTRRRVILLALSLNNGFVPQGT